MKTPLVRILPVLFAALLPCAAGALPAPAATTPAAVLDCWAAALGGRERLAALRALERAGAVQTGGMEGTFRSWHTSAGALRTEVKVGPYESTEAFDGTRGWTRTGSAPAHDLAGADLERMVSEGYTESFSMFFPDRLPGTVVLAPSEDGPVLEIAPRGGRTMTVRFDAASCLPRSVEQAERDRTLRVEFLSWTEVEGMRFPEKLRQTTGDPAYDLVVTYRTIRVNAPLPEGLFAAGADAAAGVAWNGRASVSTPLELTQNHPYVPVFVNGKGPSMFILDTGADLTVIEKGHAAQIGLDMQGAIEVRGSGESSLAAAMIAGPTVRLAGLDIPSEAVMAVPLGPLGLFEGRPIQGILGYDVLSRLVVELDYAGRRVIFHDPAGFTAPPDARAFDVTFDGNTPVIRAGIALPDGRAFDVRLTLDTGSRAALTLNRPFVEAHRVRESLATLADAPLGMGVGGLTRQDVGRLASLTLGDTVLRSPLTGFSADESGANASPDIDGNLGGEVLRRFTLWVDYGRKRVLLRANGQLAEPFEYDMSGLLLAHRDASSREPAVLHVLPGSPAERAGLRVDDVLLAIDGAGTATMTLDAVRESLRQPGRALRLRVRRDQREVEVRLETRRMI